MKKKIILLSVILCGLTLTVYLYAGQPSTDTRPRNEVIACCETGVVNDKLKTDSIPEGCVFKTLFEEEFDDSDFIHNTPQAVETAIAEGLAWMVRNQLPDGGWSGGYHAYQQVMSDPNAKSDPATTAMVSMAILRCTGNPNEGPYAQPLERATEFLLTAVETTPPDRMKITTLTGTQPQTKLGQNIDAMLTSQYLTNLLRYYKEDHPKYKRIRVCIQGCVSRIQSEQNANGSFKGAGWAGVLQSSFANNALESAAAAGIQVDTAILNRSVEYQKKNVSADKGSVVTSDAAGIILYGVSSTGRASAKQALAAKKVISQAKKQGKVKEDAEVSRDNLMKAGMSETEAMKYETAYKVNQSSNKMAVQDNVMAGFGNNGGEEFVSFLQTGEGLIISHDKNWKQWYDNVSGKLLVIREKDGYWRGHHCITNPSFCTATCLLILSVQNDIHNLLAIGNH